MPFYELDLVCPIEWPLHPNYPIDNVYVQPATSPVVSTSTPFTEEVPEVTIDWLRSLYLDCLYSLDKLKDMQDLDRVGLFAQSLRCWLPPISEDILARALEPLGECDKKWRTLVPQTIADPAQSDLQEDERNALMTAHQVFMEHNTESGKDVKGKSRWRSVTQREWVGSLEFVEHQLQIVLLLEILSHSGIKREMPIAEEPDHEAHLDLLTDRLAIHQALHGIGDLLSNDSLKGAAHELDDVQQFWQEVVEAHFGTSFPREVLLDHRTKIFPDIRTPTPFSDMEEDAESFKPRLSASIAPPSPFSHPTPNLMRLAQSVQDAQEAAETSASAVPASPTLAKLLGVNAGSSKDDKRKFSRSKSSGAMAFAAREVSMGSRRSASVEAESQAGQQKKAALFGGKNKARTSKRKQASPKKSNGKTLVMATPARKLSRTTSLPSFAQSLEDSQSQSQSQEAFSFAALGKAFRPGSQLFNGFDPISEGAEVLCGETPRKQQYMDVEMQESLGVTPG